MVGILLLGVAACRTSELRPDASVGVLTDTTVPQAVAGDPQWPYQQSATADFDGDGTPETAVILSDAPMDSAGVPLWHESQRWQVYIEEVSGQRTHLYRRFLPGGTLTADVVRRESGTRTLLLVARTAGQLNVYEVKYSGPQRVVLMNRLERPIERGAVFDGMGRP